MYLFAQAAKILANLIVMGSGMLARAFVQAYRQALASKFFGCRNLMRIVSTSWCPFFGFFF
jgi:hypothetical protein